MDRGSVLPRSRAGRGRAPHGVRPLQRDGQRAAELHAHFEPLCAPRLSRAGERAAERGPAQDGRGRQRRGEHDARPAPRTSAVPATAAPTTPRAIAPPARPSVRSTGSSSTSSTAASSWSSGTASARSRVRALARRSSPTGSRAPASTSTASRGGSTRSSRRTSADGRHAQPDASAGPAAEPEEAAPDRPISAARHDPARLAGRALRDRQRRPSTSCSGRFPPTRTGSTRSARRR